MNDDVGPRHTVLAALRAAAATPEGSSVAAQHDEDYEIAIEGEMPIVVRLQDGTLSVHTGGAVERRPFSYSRITFTRDGVERLRSADVSPAEAADIGLIEIQSRLYGGGQITRLLAIAQTGGLFNDRTE